MRPSKPDRVRESGPACGQDAMLSPFKSDEWKRLSPAERLDRSWKLRDRIPDLAAVHDCKLFPKP